MEACKKWAKIFTQTIKQLYLLHVQPIAKYASFFWQGYLLLKKDNATKAKDTYLHMIMQMF